MKLLINGLSARLGGGQTYLYQLLQHLPKEWQITLITSGHLIGSHIPDHIHLVVKPELANPFRRAWWEYTRLERFALARDIELIFNPACLLPRLRSGRIKTAVTFQNMLPFDVAQRRAYPIFSYRRLRDMLLEWALLSAMRRSDLVIFISRYARDYIAQHKKIHPKQSVVIPHAVDERFSLPMNLPEHMALTEGSYFLYVSFLDFYKCQREVLQAFAELKTQHQRTEKLVFVGAGYPRYISLVKQDIIALGLQNDVLLLGNISHALLPALYQHAKANLFASICENCPNILMEMMASGVPALVSNYGPMPEIAADTVTYFDPRNHREFVSQWAQLLQCQDEAKHNALHAAQKVMRMRWESAVGSTAEALVQVVKSV